jgi:hypothetical protein
MLGTVNVRVPRAAGEHEGSKFVFVVLWEVTQMEMELTCPLRCMDPSAFAQKSSCLHDRRPSSGLRRFAQSKFRV